MKMNNNKNVWILTIIALILEVIIIAVPPISAITLQELIDSYSFDYYGGEIDISSVSDYM